MSEWKKVKLGEIGKIITGKTPPTKDKDNYGGNIPFITPVDMVGNRNVFITERYLTEKGKNVVKNCLLPANTICVSCIGSDMGKAVITTQPSITNQQINSIIVDDAYDFRFVFYLMLTQTDVIKSLGKNSTAVPILNKSKFCNIEVSLPSLSTQHRIAAILSRYDSLIENYQKQIKLLEEAAQRLYKEWFVDLHFPGHENTKIVDGVPEGWEKKRVGDMLISHMNGGWGKDSSTGSNVIQAPVIRGTDIDKIKGGVFDNLPIRFHTEKEILNKHLEVNDIILELSNGNINNVGRTLRIDDNLIKQYGKRVICASFCKFLRPIDYRISILLFSEFQDMHNGSRMQKFKKNGANGINNFDFQEFLKHEVLVPPVCFTIKELEIIQNSISDYRIQIRLLTEARDRLLPKLMNEEIKV